jgi:hypothetical protein
MQRGGPRWAVRGVVRAVSVGSEARLAGDRGVCRAFGGNYFTVLAAGEVRRTVRTSTPTLALPARVV